MAILSVPLKTVIMYWADTQNESFLTTTLTNGGYHVCNGATLDSSHQDINPSGTYTLPDLRNYFILGADHTKAFGTAGNAKGNNDTAAGAPGPGGSGGLNSYTLIIDEIPPHNHGLHKGIGNGADNVALVASAAKLDDLNFIVDVGGGNPHDNRPRYIGLVLVMKVKL